MNSLEATGFLLAEHINRLTGDRDFTTRLITKPCPAQTKADAEAGS
jgi:hypothetical protein